MAGKIVSDSDLTLKEKVMEWLFSQGAVTVLLFLILAGAWYGIPHHTEQVKQGYKEINENNNKTLEKIETVHEREMNRVIDIMEGKHAAKDGDKTTFNARAMRTSD